MDVKEVLRFADEMVFAKTGEHLDDLQEAILGGVWEGQKYSQIAEVSHCSEGHVRNVASKLWKRLSNVLGEEVAPSNLRLPHLRDDNYSSFHQIRETIFLLVMSMSVRIVNFQNIHKSDRPQPPPQTPPNPKPD